MKGTKVFVVGFWCCFHSSEKRIQRETRKDWVFLGFRIFREYETSRRHCCEEEKFNTAKNKYKCFGHFLEFVKPRFKREDFSSFCLGPLEEYFLCRETISVKGIGGELCKRRHAKGVLNFIRTSVACKNYKEMMNTVRPSNADKRKQFANLIIMCINLNAPFTPIMVQLSCCSCIHSLRTLFIAVWECTWRVL